MTVVGCDNGALAPFKELMLRTCGLAFDKERERTLANGLMKRMAAVAVTSFQAYHGRLIADQQEFHRLVESLTVNETYFYREPDYLRLMAERMVPEIMNRREGPVRILSAGCSTGEEPYSAAIMLRERYGGDCERFFAIAGVDIDAVVIGAARQGVYGGYSFRSLEPGLRERYFEPCGSALYRVRDSVKRLVEFDTANLLGASYPQVMQSPDIILYRNVSIYFPGQVQRTIFNRLAETLNEGGYLVVGATETMHHDVGILSLVERDSLFVFHKRPPGAANKRLSMAGKAVAAPGRSGSLLTRPPALKKAPARSGTTFLDRTKRIDATAGQPAVAGRDETSLFAEALELARTGRDNEALPLLETLIGKNPDCIKALSLKACVLLDSSRYPEARALCEGILERDPLCLEGYLVLGIIALHEGDGDEAYRRFREAIYLDASCWPAHFHLAGIAFSRGDGKRARSGFEAALRILENESLRENARCFFPLSFTAEQFVAICRHKLSILKERG